MGSFRNRRRLSLISAFLILPLTCPAQQQELAPDTEPPFRIRVMEGDGSINNIRQSVNRAATVVVEDENRYPLSGVSVTFFLPNDGPSGLFPNGSRVLTVFTDEKGLASSQPVQFNNQVGIMRIGVSASLFAQTANALITQTNVSSAAALRSSYVPAIGQQKMTTQPRSKKWIAVLAIVAAGAGAGYFLATRKSTPNATLSTGIPTVGAPGVTGPR